MNIDLNEIIPAHLHPQSKVWIYQGSRLFGMGEAFELEEMFEAFLKEWKCHGANVSGYGNLFYGQFIVLIADESVSEVGGCTIDRSIHFIKELEQKFKIELLNRQNLAFYINEKVQILPLPQLKHAIENGFITGDTLYFNNVVSTKEELVNKWLIPVKQSWLGKKFPV
jgi:hypothetical protein